MSFRRVARFSHYGRLLDRSHGARLKQNRKGELEGSVSAELVQSTSSFSFAGRHVFAVFSWLVGSLGESRRIDY